MMKQANTNRHKLLGVRHGDMVMIMAGRSKGKSGKVLSVNPEKRTVTVEHANIIKKHTRANPQKNIRGGILEKEGPVHISNVMLVCPGCGKHTRVGSYHAAERRQSSHLPPLQCDV